MKSTFTLTKTEKSWALYDVANSAFTLIVITTFMPLFFKDFAAAGMDSATSTATWAFTVSLASVILAFLSPVLGALADYQGFKKTLWGVFLVTGAVLGTSLIFLSEGQWILATILYIGATIAYTTANMFYDSFLHDVTTEDRLDRVSGIGFGWGYIGSVIPFVVSLGVILVLGFGPNGEVPVVGMKIAFVISVVWWLLFSLPMARNVKHQFGIAHSGIPLRTALSGAFSRLWTTLKDARGNKPIFLFLLAYFFYIDGVNTIISTATAYGRDLGLSAVFLIALVLMIQVVAWPFSLFFGRAATRFGRKPLILVAIGVYTIICFGSAMVPSLPTKELQMIVFWIMAFLIATSQGGIQALSRSYFAALVPPEKSAEYFGFYDIFGKFAAILGPFLLGLMTTITGQSRWGILSLTFLFIVGGILLILTPRQRT